MKFSWFKFKRDKTAQTSSQTPSKASAKPVQAQTPLENACVNTDAAQRLAAFNSLSAQADYLHIVTQGRFPDTRLLAAEALVDEEPLRKAYQAAKQKDKAAARVLKTKVAEIDAQRATLQNQQQSLEKTLADAANLGKAAWSPNYNASYQSLLLRWQQLQDISNADQQAMFELAQTQIKAKLDENRPKADAPKDQQRICEQLEQMAIAVQQANLVEAQIAASDWSTVTEAFGEQWAATVAHSTPEEGIQQRYLAGSQSLRSATQVLDLLNQECQHDDFTEQGLARLYSALKAADWRLQEQPLFFEELRVLLSEVKANRAELADQIEAQRGEIHKLFAALRRAIKEGRLVPARSMAIKLEHLLDEQYAIDVTSYKEQLESLQQEVSKLMDWNAFATTPKFAELVTEMRELCEQSIEVEEAPVMERQKAIKTLQNQWRELGRNDDAEQWQLFQELGHKAYEPVKAYFDEQRKIRASNLSARAKICEKLTTTLEQTIENGDYKNLEKQMFYARREWGDYRNVDRKDSLPVKERFDHLIEQINKHLEPQYAANIAAKENLIERMQGLAEQELSQHLVHQARELQAAWKQVGITQRKDDQALWQRFNEQASKIFDALKEERNKAKAEENALFDQAKACIDELRNLAPDTNEDGLDAIINRFKAIDLGDNRGVEKIQQAFDKALAEFEAARDKAAQQANSQQLQLLLQRAQLCHQAELATEAEREQLLANWGETVLENSAWQAGIEARKAALLFGQAGTAEATEQRRLICLRLEISQDVESPAEDKALRMDYQLNRLKQGQREQFTGDELQRELQVAWCLAPAAQRDKAEALEQRFQQLIQ